MKIRNGRMKWGYGLLVLLFCILLNLCGRHYANLFRLPVWFDMVGTCLAIYLLGFPYGVGMTVVSSAVFSFFYQTDFLYVFSGIACAAVLDYCTRKKYLEKLSTILYSSFLAGFSAVLVSTPINLVCNGGQTGNVWGDALFEMLRWYHCPLIPAALAGEVAVEVLDKQLCLLTGGAIILLFQRVIRWDKWLKTAEKTVGVLLAVLLTSRLFLLPVQAETGNIERYSSRVYNNQNGMMSSEANVIEETDDGCIWIGSYAGLTKFDGNQFVFLKDSGISSVTAMYCDTKGRLWVGTNESGIARYENGRFRFFKTEDGLPVNSIRCFCEDETGRIFVGTTDRVCVFETDDSIRVVDNSIYYIGSMTIQGDLLICCDNNGKLYALRDGQLTASSGESGLGKIFFHCVNTTGLGLTAGAADSYLYQLKVDEEGFHILSKTQLPVKGVRRIVENERKMIWVCAEDGFGYLKNGLFYEQSIDHFSTSLECIHEDYQGNLWVASSRNGVLCLAASPFENLFEKNNIPEVVCNAVIPYMNGYMVGTDSGLMLIDRIGGLRESGLTKHLQGSRVRSIMPDSQGQIWISTYSEHGLVCLQQSGKYQCINQADYPEIPSNRIRSTLELRNGTIAVGTADGMFFLQDGEVVQTLTKADGLRNSQILTMLEDGDGRLYAGSDGAGIFVIEDGKIVENLTVSQGLSSDVILRLVPCQDGMLVVTSNGLCLAGNKDKRKITVLTAFPYYNNYDVLMEGDTVYVLSSGGIFVVDYHDLIANKDMPYSLYNANYGLHGAITSNSWNYIGEDGSLNICCNDGVVNFRPVSEDSVWYKYGITQLLCDGEEIMLQNGTARIPGNASEVIIRGALHNYALTDAKVKFYLEGGSANAEPVSFTAIEPIHINSPSPGVYRIHFEIYDSTGKQLLDQQIFTLTKEVQMWEKPYFKAYIGFIIFDMCIFLIFIIVLLLDDHRKKKALKEFNVKLAEKVKEQTKEITSQKEQQAELLERTVLALARTVDAKDRYTSGHSTRVAMYSKMIAQRMGKSPEEQEEIYRAGLLHDVGKIRVSEDIINKTGKLTPEEYENMKLHPITGYHILKEISEDRIFSDGARFHHERYDGNGYPNGLCGEQIPEIARIVGVADAYDAMASNRSYRQALPQHIVRSEIQNGSGTQFDPRIAEIMLQMIDEDKEYLMREHSTYQKRILVVDDETINIRLIEFTFKDDDTYLIEGASTGAQALERLRRESFDIVLMDVKMPGMDGYETARRIREFSPIPIVFVTADKLSLDMEEMKAYNITDFITRPFKPHILMEILHAVLAR